MPLYTSASYGVSCDICRRFCPQSQCKPSKEEAKARAISAGFAFLKDGFNETKAVCPDCQQLLLRAAVFNSSSKLRWRVRSFRLLEHDDQGEVLFQTDIAIPDANQPFSGTSGSAA